MNLTDLYINNINKRRKKKEYRELSLFGYGFGTFSTLFFFYKYITNDNKLYYDNFYIILICFGLFILLLTIISPYLVKILKKILSIPINIIFSLIFGLLLTILYYIVITPIGIIMRLKQKKKLKQNTNFIIKKEENNDDFTISYNKLYQLCRIIRMFLTSEYIFILPSIIIIILIGLLFIFLQSNVVAPFIYSLF